jgi:hypothetical protein
MNSETKPQFLHRKNADGTFDSICSRCFVTVATRFRETDLSRPERDHVCDSWTLVRFSQIEDERPC